MSDVLIETIGYNGLTWFIAKNKIMGAQERPGYPQQTVLIMACGTESEEWFLGESVQTFRIKYDNA